MNITFINYIKTNPMGLPITWYNRGENNNREETIWNEKFKDEVFPTLKCIAKCIIDEVDIF